MTNKLYYGDNLEVLHNVLFKSKTGEGADAQHGTGSAR